MTNHKSRTGRAVHTVLATTATVTAIALGVVVIATLIPRDVLAFLVSCSWGAIVGLAGLAYYETRVK